MKKSLLSSLFLMICLITSNIIATNILTPQRLASNNTEEAISISKTDLAFVKNLQDKKKEVLTLGQNCLFLLTPGKDPYINIYQPDLDSYKVIKLGFHDEETNKNDHITSAKQFENIIVLSEMTNIFSANIRMQKKYPGDRESKLGEALSNIFFSKDKYKGKIFIDEYKKNIPMFWVLNNVEELRSIAKYITKNLIDIETQDNPLLVIKILNDPKFETLLQEDVEFLNSYFNICSTQDPEIKEFFEKAKKSMLDRGFDMSSPRHKGESILESVFRQTEKQFKEWKSKDWAIFGGVLLATKILYNPIKTELNDGWNYLETKARGEEKTVLRRCAKASWRGAKQGIKKTGSVLKNAGQSLKNTGQSIVEKLGRNK